MKLATAMQTPEVPKQVPVALFSGSFEEKLKKAADTGYDGIEIMTADPASLDAELIKRQITDSGLSVASIGSGAVAFSTGLTLLHGDSDKAAQANQRFKDLIDFARNVGSPIVTVGSFRGRVSNVSENGREKLIDIMIENARYAQDREIRICIEPLNRYESDIITTAKEALDFVKEAGSPFSLGILLDTYHVNIEESSWTEPFTELMKAEKLWHIHLGDNNRLPTGKGMINFATIVNHLRELHYEGYLSAELLAKPDPDTAGYQTYEHMHELLANRT